MSIKKEEGVTEVTEVTGCFQKLIADYTNTKTAKNYQNFLSSFERYLGNRRLSLTDINKEEVNHYKSWLVDNGCQLTYINQYLQYFRTLYNKTVREGWTLKTDAFDEVLSVKPKAIHEHLRSSESITTLRKLIKLDLKDKPYFTRIRDLFLFTVFTGGLSYEELTELKKTDLQAGYLLLPSGRKQKLLPILLHIIEKHRTTNETSLFSLRKEEHTNYYKYVEAICLLAEVDHIIDQDTALSLYLAIGRDVGVKASQLKSTVDRLPAGSSLSMIEKEEISQERADEISERIVLAVKDYRAHWYSMRLFRPEEEIEEEIQSDQNLQGVELYYPMEEITRRVGKKIEEIQSPVIKNILFFRTTEAMTHKLARALYGQANIYKTRTSEKESYAIIPDYEMYQFRMIVSNGAEEIHFEEIKKEEFTTGRRVRIIDGKFCGYEGKIVRKKGENIILVSLCNVQFTVTAGIPDAFLQLL
ncbi:MAG: UpxY family transcription antiterminator [Parabacteroides sp.]|nr:UpxY family transcription antiterminator [Parabacteroides sp.]